MVRGHLWVEVVSRYWMFLRTQILIADTLELATMRCGKIYTDYALASDDWDGSDPAIPTGRNLYISQPGRS